MEHILDNVMQEKNVDRWSNAPGHRLAIGLIDKAGTRYWRNGQWLTEPDADHAESLYEVGSITKTMTGFLLAIGEQEGIWSVDNKLSDLAPELTGSPFASATTLRQLATHTAGLPRMPGNFRATITDKQNPYASYSDQHITEAVLAEPLKSGNRHAYSNYGFGLLGWILAKRLNMSLSHAFNERLFQPLGMMHTLLRSGAPAPAAGGLVPVYNAKGISVPHWDFQDTMAGAGAVCSTVPDMLHYLKTNLHPENTPFPEAIAECQREHYSIFASRGIGVGYSWMFYKEQDGSTTHWHNGGTYGSSSFAAFNRDKGKGLVVLSNRGSDVWSQIPFIGKRKLSVDKLARMLLDGFYRMSD
ncbi:serine hydrolase domain-containing protein [Paenibacillus agaridevorans]|uniref:serine hydrolase domain-containing protein n=1 Tax=Paenibacillus agaridevorans TaxID=171404 RepID=UPI001BE49CDE|nr:serine hydrolase domain-containing protein [Paenibacillus agaridevorans]